MSFFKIGEYFQTRPRKGHQPLRKQKYDGQSTILRFALTLPPTLFNKKYIDIHSVIQQPKKIALHFIKCSF